MIPATFEYQRPGTIDEAIKALSGEDVKLLAGGHSLLPAMKLRLNRPATLVDITRISDLHGIHEEDGEIVIGAASTHADILRDDYLHRALPLFPMGAAMIGDVQIRNYGTIGGSLAHADPAADWPAMVLAVDAAIEVQGPEGKRRISSKDFFTGLFSTALHDNELITAIRIPVPPGGTKATYQKFSQPASRFAIAGVAAIRQQDGLTRIAITGIGDNAFRAEAAESILSGKPLNEENINAAVAVALDGISPLSDRFASATYRLHLARVYLKKALLEIA